MEAVRFGIGICIWPMLFIEAFFGWFSGAGVFVEDRSGLPGSFYWAGFFAAVAFASATTFLLTARFGAEITFRWLYFAGLIFLGIALAIWWWLPPLPEYRNSEFWHASKWLICMLEIWTAVVMGVGFLILATVQDLLGTKRR